MTLSSLELTRRCVEQGLLSKEAMHDVLRIRQRLYKKAMAEKAAGVFGAIGKRLESVGARAAQKASSFADDLKGQLGFAGMTGAKSPVHGDAHVLRKGVDEASAVFPDDFEQLTGQVIKDAPKQPKSWGAYAGDLGKLMALGAGIQGTGMAVTGLMRHSRDKGVKKDIENSYKEMFVEHPQLATLDPQKVTRHFDVLARYAPSLAADPTVAGAWVKGTVQMGHVDATAVERLGATQALIDRHHEGRALFKPEHFTSAMGVAQKAMGGGGDK